MIVILRIIVTAVAVWLATLLPLDLSVTGGEASWWQRALAFAGIGALLVAVNAIVRPIVNVLTFPVRVLTLGLFGLIINWAMLWLVAWLSERVSFLSLTIGSFWQTFWAALFISVVTAFLAAMTGARR